MSNAPDAPNGAKPWYLSKTLWFNALTLALLAIDLAIGANAITTPKALPWITVFIGVGNAVLRLLTGAPIERPIGGKDGK